MMNSQPPLQNRASTSEEAPAVTSLPSVVLDFRHAPTVRMQVPVSRRRAVSNRAARKLLGCALLVLAAVLLLVSPRVLSGRAKLKPSLGTAEILDFPSSAANVTGLASAKVPVKEPAVESQDALIAEAASLKPSPLRKVPRRGTVRHALQAVEPLVTACIASGSSARVRITFVGASGHAVRAKVLGGAPPGAAACIARAVHQARVPVFGSRRHIVEHTFGR